MIPFHHGSASETVSEFIAQGLKRLHVFKPVILGTTTFFAVDSLFDSLIFDEENKGKSVRKPIEEVDDIYGQNRLFSTNLK